MSQISHGRLRDQLHTMMNSLMRMLLIQKNNKTCKEMVIGQEEMKNNTEEKLEGNPKIDNDEAKEG